MAKSNRPQLVWLRRDLRSRDNKALYYASLQGPVVCVWLSFEQQWQEHHDSPNKLWFWLQNLAPLKKNLQAFHIPLVTRSLQRFDQAPQLLCHLAQDMHCEALWFNNEYEINENNRDNAVENACAQAGIACHRFHDDVLRPPGSLRNKQDAPYKVFTPFRKAVYHQLTTDQWQPLPAPEQQQPLTSLPPSDPLPEIRPSARNIEVQWPAGEKQAHKALKDFIQNKAQDYKTLRDFPAVAGTSTVSPWLAAGVLSIRQCFSMALAANNGELDTGNEGLQCWLSELVWREFYRHILVQFPRVCRNKAFRPETDKLDWKKDEGLLERWKTGKTGVPIVDAAMRQLTTTGWMHNRLRMIVAMYLSKHLQLDWRLGERFFMEHLIDGDLASNNGGWQWASSTGTDAAPWFRIFNPVTQSRRFDPDGAFLRQWLPELAGLDNKTIHDPSEGAAGNPLFHKDNGYPAPIVDLKLARDATLARFKALKSATGD